MCCPSHYWDPRKSFIIIIIVVFVSMLFNSISITKVEHVESIDLFIIRVMNVND